MPRPPPKTSSILLTLLLLLLTLPATRCTPTARNMEAPQIPGNYENVELTPNVGYCPDGLRFSQVEPLQTEDGVLYVLPHSFISIPLKDGGVISCSSETVENNTLVTESSTILRRNTQLNLTATEDIIAQFQLAQEEFYIGFEVGARTCGKTRLPPATISMWMAPESAITARVANVAVTFTRQYKYIYYFSTDKPCLFRGNAAERGEIKQVPSSSPSPTPPPSPSPLPPPASPQPSQPVTPAAATPNPTGGSAFPPQQDLPNTQTVTTVRDPVCFPGKAQVEDRGGVKRMDQVRVGDELLADGGFSKVFAITHAEKERWYEFVTLETDANLSVTLTEGHFVMANGYIVRAGEVRVGDWMMGSGGKCRVVSVGRRVEKGLFSVQTESGMVWVDGLLVTAYSSVLGGWESAHAALTPFRMFGEWRVAWFDGLRWGLEGCLELFR